MQYKMRIILIFIAKVQPIFYKYKKSHPQFIHFSAYFALLCCKFADYLPF